MVLKDTIAAVATPPGEGGVALVRVSGPAALGLVGRSFEPTGVQGRERWRQGEGYTAHHGWIRRGDVRVDEVLVTVFRAPRSYTGEDVVEIGCHGGPVVTRMVLETVLGCGARLAQPGEFTQRAFLNGKMDLTQAEAVNDLIHARTRLAAAAAASQLGGSLSRKVEALRDDLMLVLAHVEAHIDFPDEDIEPATARELDRRLERVGMDIEELLATADEGRVLREGLRLAIVGRPNAGKSSLLNGLLGFERAIVAPVPGTTRDTIEETANIRGIPVILVDTAGQRDSGDWVEQEGMRRSRLAEAEADLVLRIVDGSEELSTDDRAWMTAGNGNGRRLVVVNKVDLPTLCELPGDVREGAVRVSCRTGEGLALLKERIEMLVWSGRGGPGRPDLAVNVRQADALRRARDGVQAARRVFEADAGLELVSLELRVATDAVGEVVGGTGTEDLLDRIFSTFCLGK